MIRYKLVLLLCFFLVPFLQGQDFKTYTYFANDSISLDLDLFLPGQVSDEKIPLLIFVHGGGFSNGYREKGHNLAKYLNSRDMACATISYTLFMKGKSFGCDGILS